jgi:hypothetical protein
MDFACSLQQGSLNCSYSLPLLSGLLIFSSILGFRLNSIKQIAVLMTIQSKKNRIHLLALFGVSPRSAPVNKVSRQLKLTLSEQNVRETEEN